MNIATQRSGGVDFWVRPETTDANTVLACAEFDEYGMAEVDVTGKVVIDVGAHIGGFAVWMAVRGADVVAVEPIPDNVQLIGMNAARNGVDINVVQAVAGVTGKKAWVEYGFTHDENARAHAFIGSTAHSEHACQRVEVPEVGLTRLIEWLGCPPPDVVKLDCEGGEWDWFADPALASVPLIVGEWHPVLGHTRAEVVAALDPTHRLEFTGPEAGPGGFRATVRW
jgi:FkbM family methyltransferase